MVQILKVYLDNAAGQSIRRLTVNSDVVSSYTLLLNKLQKLLQVPLLDMVVKWKDAENDFIMMSSDEELAQAVANSVDGLLKIYVTVKSGTQKLPELGSGFIGLKPMLWSSIHNMEMVPPIPMGSPTAHMVPPIIPMGPPTATMVPPIIPMGPPVSRVSVAPWSDCAPSMVSPSPPAQDVQQPLNHDNVLCDGCDYTIHGIRYKCLSCKDYDLCSSCNAKGKHSQHDMVKLVKPVDQQREWAFMGSRRLWSSMFQRRKSRSPKVCGGKSPTDGVKDFPWAFQKLLSGDAVPVTQKVVDSLSKLVMGSADFRIENPAVLMESLNKKQKTEGDAAASEAAAVPMETADSAPQDAKMGEPRGLFQPKPQPLLDVLNTAVKSLNLESPAKQTPPLIDLEPATAPEAETSSVDGWCLVQGEDPDFIEASSTATSGTTTPAQASTSFAAEPVVTIAAVGTAAAEADESVAYVHITPAAPVGAGPYSPGTVSSGLGNDGTAQENSAEQNNNQSAASSYFVESKDPVIINSVYAMMNMGFSNEGGWLEKLLTSKGGNVNDALDSLYPLPHGH